MFLQKTRFHIWLFVAVFLFCFRVPAWAASDYTLLKGESIQLEDKNSSWESTSPKVASVSKGKVTALSQGTTKIIRRTIKGNTIYIVKWTVSVLERKKIYITKGESAKFSVSGSNWKSSNAGIVSVKNGKITGNSKGSAIVSANIDGKVKEWDVIVETPVYNHSSAVLFVGESIRVNVSGTARRAAFTYTYDKYNHGVCSYKIGKNMNERVLTAKKPGKMSVHIRIGNKTYNCKINVITKESKEHPIYKSIMANKNHTRTINGCRTYFDPEMNSYQVVACYKLVKTIPVNLIQNGFIKNIFFYKNTASLKKALGKHIDSNIAGYFRSVGMRIYVGDAYVYTSTPGSTKHILYHEVGHAIYHKYFFGKENNPQLQKWKKIAAKEWSKNNIYKKGIIEVFAEAYSFYKNEINMTNRPQTARFFRDLGL